MHTSGYVALMGGAVVVSGVTTNLLMRDDRVDAKYAQLRRDMRTPRVWVHIGLVVLLVLVVRLTHAPPRVLAATNTAVFALVVAYLGHIDAWFSAFFLAFFGVLWGLDI